MRKSIFARPAGEGNFRGIGPSQVNGHAGEVLPEKLDGFAKAGVPVSHRRCDEDEVRAAKPGHKLPLNSGRNSVPAVLAGNIPQGLWFGNIFLIKMPPPEIPPLGWFQRWGKLGGAQRLNPGNRAAQLHSPLRAKWPRRTGAPGASSRNHKPRSHESRD